MINSRLWARKLKTRRKNKPNEGRNARYSDNKTIMGD